MLRPMLLAATLLPGLAACAATDRPSARPDLLARVQQDCEGGDANACLLLQGFAPKSPVRARRSSAMRTQVEQDVDALMQGMLRARSASRPAAIDVPGPGEL